jgi:hypothetical protein
MCRVTLRRQEDAEDDLQYLKLIRKANNIEEWASVDRSAEETSE